MQKSKVAIVRCDAYNSEIVHAAVARAIDLVGGAGAFVKAGERILLKPNVLAGADPSAAVTTHPTVFEGVILSLRTVGADLSYGDSPAFHKTAAAVKKGGFAEVAERLNVPLADFEHTVKVEHPSPLFLKTIPLAKGVVESDGLVSISKLKTHALTRLTGAIKNQYGCIPGLTKGQYHTKAPMVTEFSAMLVDINTYIKPRLYVMDAVIAMEGNGPNSGDPKYIGCILASSDPVALDATAARIVDCDPRYVPTAQAGERAGLGTWKAEEIELVGDPIVSFVDKTFRVIRSPAVMVYGGGILKEITSRIAAKPVIDAQKCIKCGRCVEICPVEGKAVDWKKGKAHVPVYTYVKCIRCYCCQETCPHHAITVHTPKLAIVLPMLASLSIVGGGIQSILKRLVRMIIGKKK